MFHLHRFPTYELLPADNLQRTAPLVKRSHDATVCHYLGAMRSFNNIARPSYGR